jgi:L-asparaginase II
VLAEVVRSGFVESVHRGSFVVLSADGSEVLRAGTTDQPMFPRSSNKPMQATALLDCGLDLDGRLLALAAASHAGEDFHVTGVREILARAGLTEADLQCPPDLPTDEAVKADLLRAGGGADRVHMNCSGKHAAMLATCVAAGWPVASYRDPDHPLQRQIKLTIESLTGEKVSATGVDGCGAPVLAISLSGLARAYRELVLSKAGSAPRRVADAMRGHPAWTSGSSMPEAMMMGAVPGLLMKAGAEGVCAFALGDGRAAALKIDDGTRRAVPPVAAALLLDLIGAGGDLAAIESLRTTPVMGGGQPAGEIRPVAAGGPA